MNGIDDLLEKTCKNMIKTILSCLDHATKGTIYRIGSMPKLQAVRITSGTKVSGRDELEWGLPAQSDYNYPGKTWEQYRDRPDHILEAMGWCVEKQKSWTAENPFEDVRSVRKQLRGEIEDYYHMEPVLVRKVDMYGGCPELREYPRDWLGSPIWQDSEYVTAAVVKIHFLPDTIHRDDRSTKIIQELARSLGTELLSLHLRENLYKSQKQFARHRIESCKILAHELRNTLIKFGFLFSAVNAEIGVLRDEWETLLRKSFPGLEWKHAILERLSELILSKMRRLTEREELRAVWTTLLSEQQEMIDLSLLPEQGEQWLRNKIEEKWERLLTQSNAWETDRDEIRDLLFRLRKALWLGRDESLAKKLDHLPPDLLLDWVRLSYVYFTQEKLHVLEEILGLLERPELPVAHKERMKKVLNSLKVLVEVVPEIEEKANKIILSLRYGGPLELDALEEFNEVSCAWAPPGDQTQNRATFAE